MWLSFTFPPCRASQGSSDLANKITRSTHTPINDNSATHMNTLSTIWNNTWNNITSDKWYFFNWCREDMPIARTYVLTTQPKQSETSRKLGLKHSFMEVGEFLNLPADPFSSASSVKSTVTTDGTRWGQHVTGVNGRDKLANNNMKIISGTCEIEPVGCLSFACLEIHLPIRHSDIRFGLGRVGKTEVAYPTDNVVHSTMYGRQKWKETTPIP